METGGSKGRGCRGRGTGGLKFGWVRLGGGWEEEKSTGSVWTTWCGLLAILVKVGVKGHLDWGGGDL